MQKIDLQVVSIPDHEAQLEIARIIVSGNHTISMQAAIEMAKNPPILLFHNMDVKDVKQYLNTFERLGIAFKVKILEDAPADTHSDPAKPAAPPEHAAAENPQESAGAHKNRQPTDDPQPDDPPEPANARRDHHVSDDSQESADTNLANQPADGPQVDDDAMQEFADIKAHNSTVDRNGDGDAAPATPSTPADQDHTAHPLHTPLYAASSAGSAHGRQMASGIRVGHIGIDELAKKEEASRKKSLMITSIAIGILIILGITTLFLPKNSRGIVSKTAPVAAKKDKKSAAKSYKSAPAPAAPTQQNSDRQRNSVSNQQKQQSSAYVDSAKTGAIDKENCIAFYKLAISFNRYNLPAWQGLLQAYREQGREAEANETLEQMTSVFGNEVMSVTALIKPFGDLMDAYMTSDGTYRIEYRTRKLAKDDVLREVFNMTRAVRSACSCKNISIYASTGTGKGLLAHSTQEMSVHTLSAFSKQAEIIWLK